MNQRFKDLERTIQDLHVELLQDLLKKKAEQEKDENVKCSKSEPSANSDSISIKSKRRFEKKENGKEKRYKKRFIEESDGIRAQYTTDESEGEDSKQE